MRKTLLKISLIVVLLMVSWIMPILRPAGAIIYLRLVLLLVVLAESVRLFRWFVISRYTNKRFTNVATVFMSVFVLFILLESFFMFIPRSHGIHYSLAARLWLDRYWKPINSLGYRDREPQNGTNVILFVGDSFTAGHGLKSVDERFSNIVEKEMLKQGKPCQSVNLGRNDADTVSEYKNMVDFFYWTKIKPRTIVLQYSGNDIERAAVNNGMYFEGFKPPESMNPLLIAIGSGSYFLNYLFWLLPHPELSVPYIHFLTQAYQNKTVMTEHKENLQKFIEDARRKSINLIVIVFPFLQDLEMSDQMYVKEIVSFFEGHHVPTINVTPLVKNIPLPDRIINVNDAHASAKVHKIVADEILKRLDP